MSCISMATGTGPWIESTLVLISFIAIQLLHCIGMRRPANSSISLAVAAGGIAGIAAVACGWTFPTLYFLKPELFMQWMANPIFFITLLAIAVLIAGAYGILLANLLERSFLDEQNMSFPIGELVHKTITAQQNMRQSLQLACGALISSMISFSSRLIPGFSDSFCVFREWQIAVFRIPTLLCRLDTLPMYWAIGFVTGHLIAIPLAVGVISKIVFVDTLHHFFFSDLKTEYFLLAFITGMVVYGALVSFIEVPSLLKPLFKRMRAGQSATQLMRYEFDYLLLAIGILLFCFFWYFNFTIWSGIYVLIGTALCVYQLLIIAGKTGLAPFPRFATFVMMPGLVFFGFDAVQVMIVSLFVEVCGGVAVDTMFGRKLAMLAAIDRKRMARWQWIGLIVGAVTIAIVFWLLINRFGLGGHELFVQRAKARAVLAQANQFNYWAMLCGALFSILLKFIRVNPVLVIGGLAMPLDISIVLIAGGLSTYLVKNKEQYYPFWSGVFAAGSLWMLLRAL